MVMVLLSTAGYAQTGKVTVTVVNENQANLENITLELVTAKDSSLVKAGITSTSMAEEPALTMLFSTLTTIRSLSF